MEKKERKRLMRRQSGRERENAFVKKKKRERERTREKQNSNASLVTRILLPLATSEGTLETRTHAVGVSEDAKEKREKNRRAFFFC